MPLNYKKRWSPWKVRQFLNFKEGDQWPTWSDRNPSLFTNDYNYARWRSEFLNKEVPEFTDERPLDIMGHKLRWSVFLTNWTNTPTTQEGTAALALRDNSWGLTPKDVVAICNFYDPNGWMPVFRQLAKNHTDDDRFWGDLGASVCARMGSHVLPWCGRRAGKFDRRNSYPWGDLKKVGDSFEIPLSITNVSARSNLYTLAKNRNMRVAVNLDDENSVWIITRVE